MKIRLLLAAILSVLFLIEGAVPATAQRHRRTNNVLHPRVGHHFQPREEPVIVVKKKKRKHAKMHGRSAVRNSHGRHTTKPREKYLPRKLTND